MIYYTIYVKGLSNSTGYIDVPLEDDQLLKDYKQYLDVGVRPIRTYNVASPRQVEGRPTANTGVLVIDLAQVAAIMTVASTNGPASFKARGS